MGIRGELKEPEIRVIGVNFDQGKRGFQVIRVELTVYEWLKSWVKSKGIETQYELAGKFEVSEFELPRFYCILVMQRILTHAKEAQIALNSKNRKTRKDSYSSEKLPGWWSPSALEN